MKKTYWMGKQKKYRDMDVNVRLDRAVLDSLNRIPNIRVIGVCSGHSHPTEFEEMYMGNIPQIWFRHANPKKVCKNMRALRHNANFSCSATGGKDVYIKGKSKSTKAWWVSMVTLIRKSV